ncbi:MAG: hypothetical protein ABR526_07255, partial [Chthoniobacterales bacterium]
MKTTIKAVIALALCAVAPLPVHADDRPNRDNKNYQLVSFDERIPVFANGKGSLDGNVVLAGKYNDKGTRHEDFVVVGQNKDGTEAYITITGTITASQGTMTLTAIGTIHVTSQGFYYAEG